MQKITKYFPHLTKKQIQQFNELQQLYNYWNKKINVISRKDIDALYTRHILHSLSITKVIHFNQGTKVLDVGTGGGLPGIPLAIFFPKVKFHLIDSIGKKIKVVNEISKSIELNNVKAEQIRGEDIKERYDFIVSRAVTNMSKFTRWMEGKVHQKHNNKLKNGIFYLKGGDLTEELNGITHDIYDISTIFDEDFFKTKKIIYISR